MCIVALAPRAVGVAISGGRGDVPHVARDELTVALLLPTASLTDTAIATLDRYFSGNGSVCFLLLVHAAFALIRRL